MLASPGGDWPQRDPVATTGQRADVQTVAMPLAQGTSQRWRRMQVDVMPGRLSGALQGRWPVRGFDAGARLTVMYQQNDIGRSSLKQFVRMSLSGAALATAGQVSPGLGGCNRLKHRY
jgi:hypothetical protein